MFKKKLKIELPYDPAISLLGIYPKECKSTYNRDIYLHTHAYGSTIHNGQVIESAQVPSRCSTSVQQNIIQQ
jgi:hypothetical protein